MAKGLEHSAQSLRADRLVLAAIVLAGLGLRFATMAPKFAGGAPLNDPDGYFELARSMALGHGFAIAGEPTAYRPPFYPLLLVPGALLPAGSQGLWILGLHAALSALTIVLTQVSAQGFGLSRRESNAAAAIVALDPVLLASAAAIMTETTAAFLTSLVLATSAAAGRAHDRGLARLSIGLHALAGAWLGAASLCRPGFLVVAALAIAARICAPRGGLAFRARAALAVALGCAAPLSPWVVRNAWVLGSPIVATTHGGYTLELANNPWFFEDVVATRAHETWSAESQAKWLESIRSETSGMGEVDSDRALARRAVRWIRANPAPFARLVWYRFKTFWAIMPAKSVYGGGVRVAVALWTAPIWLLAIFGLKGLVPYDWPRVLAWVVPAGLCAVHLVYWTDIRMRAPAIPALAIAAAAGGIAVRRLILKTQLKSEHK